LIEDEGRRLTEMVEQVLEYARIGGNRALRRPRPVDVRSLVGDVRAACLEACVQAGVKLDVGGAAGDALQVTADEAALGRALQNLVTNAAKHAAEGQSIRIDMGSERLRRRAFVWISVADRGPGIEAHDIAHIFEPFYRGRQAVDRQVHGNGLGLSLVKRVAESHGGSVSVKSVVGEGTVFTLHLPATPPAAAAPSGAGGADFAAEAHPVGDGEPRPGALE
jgi:signal transduction histidine kinase